MENQMTFSIQNIINLCKFAGLKVEKPEEIDKDTEITVVEDQTSMTAYYTEYQEEGGFEL